MKGRGSVAEMKAKANRLHLAHEDMVEARGYLQSLEELTSVIEKYDLSFFLIDAIPAVFIALIIVYARPFVSSYSKGMADPKLDPESIQLFDNDSELEILHQRLIGLRNTAVAHSDWTWHNTELITNDKQFGLKRKHSRPDYMDGIDISLLGRLIEHVEAATRGSAYDMDVYYQAEIERTDGTK